MRPTVATCLFMSLFGVSSSLSVQEFMENLSSIDSLFVSKGPSNEILNQYDALIHSNSPLLSELEKDHSGALTKLYHKKGIIELSLGKEALSIDDFFRSLQLNPSNLGAKKSLLDLVLKHGNVDVLEKVKLLYKSDDADIQQVESTFRELDDLVKQGDLESITKAINISPSDSSLRTKRIEITTEIIKNTKETQEQLKQFINLIDDYSNLLKISPIAKSDNLNKLSEIYLFGVLEYNGALSANKKCVHYDMDHIECKTNSKILNKYNTIFQQLSQFNKVYNLWQQDEKSTDFMEINEIDIKDIVSSLTSSEKYLEIRRVNENFSTNIQFLQDKSKQFNAQYNLNYNSLDLTLLRTQIFNAFLKKSTKELKQLSSQYSKLDKSLPKFFPIILHQTDLAISKNDYNKAQEYLNSCKPNMQQSEFFQTRLEKVQAHRQQQQHHQQQQYFHQQQQQQQHHQQQHQRKSEPKNDYYTILEVPRDADLPTIKKAYREKTKQFHPDKYKGDLSDDEVQDKMTSINHAYEVLSDDNLRKNYDLGDDPNDPESGRNQPHYHHQQQHRGGNPFGNGQFNFKFGGGNGGNFHFGGMNNGRGRARGH